MSLRRVLPVLLACAAAATWFVLGAGIHLPGTQPADGSGDPAFPAFKNGTKPGVLDDPGGCAGGGCHRAYRAPGQPIYEPYDSWAGSVMANAARDPLFWACLDIANQDDARLGDAGVGDFCIRCHSPKGWYEGRSDCTTAWGEAFDGSCLTGPPTQENNDFEGVQCHFCHRMYDASQPPAGDPLDVRAPYDENGQVYLSTASRLMRGPYSDAQPPGRHEFAASPMHRQATICAQCHNVTHPALHRRDPATGADLGYRMPIERTFDEYAQSAFGRAGDPLNTTCQACHMPPPDFDGDGTIDDAFACGNPPGPRGTQTALEGPVFTHFFRGGGVFTIDLLKGEYGTALARAAEYQAARDQSLQLLQTRTASVVVSGPAQVTAGGALAANVRVTNLSGHKFPTGYPEGRRAFLTVESGEDVDGDGQLAASEVTFRSGAYDAATGELTEDAQARVYEAEMGVYDWNGTGACDLYDGAGRKMFHFVLNDCVVKDNRIPPQGFAPGPETAPVGVAYPPDPARPGALAHWDDAPYAIPVPPGATRPMLVRATLLYQTVSKDYIEFLRAENRSTCDPRDAGCNPTLPNAGANRGEKMHALWQTYGRSAPVAVAAGTVAVPVTGGAPAPGEASRPGAAGGPLRATAYAAATGVVSIAYAPACDATGHAVHWGPLSSVAAYGYAGAACAIGTSGTASFDPGAGSAFFVVVGDNGAVEGSYGRRSDGTERPEAAACGRPQGLSASCP